MKRLIYLFIVAVVLLSCQNNSYIINGSVAESGYEGTNVYLQQIAENEMITIDSTVVNGGKFSFSGVTDAEALRFIMLDEKVNPKGENKTPILVAPGKLEVAFDSVITLKGSKVNEAYSSLKGQQAEHRKNLKALFNQHNKETEDGTLTEARDEELRNAYGEISAKLSELTYNFTKENIGNKLGEHIFRTSVSMFEPEQQREIIDLAGDEYKAGENIQKIIKKLDNLEKVAVGKKFVDFTLNDPDGNEISLSDYAGKGNYVLIDFWAAWCGPCVQEMPTVVEAYKTFKPKGFEVVGVSLDKEKDSWEQGIKDLNITWPQMSDLKFWDSKVVELYAINGIPLTILLDRDGTIIEKNLRGDALTAKLAELMP